MIRYLNHHEIDMQKWDNCIHASPNGLVYAYSWYLNHVAGEWHALVEGDYDSVFPLPCKKKFGIQYIVQPYWTQQLGLFSKHLITPEKTHEFLRHASGHFRYIDMNMNSLHKTQDLRQFAVSENRNYQLQLIQTYDNLYGTYSENLKRNLKKANNQLILTEHISHEEIINLFQQNRGKKIRLLTTEAYRKLNSLIYHARSMDAAKILAVTDATNTLLCGAIFMMVKNRAIMLFSAVNETARSLGAMPWLIDRFIHQHQMRDMILDFEGSNDKNLARFYKSFGAVNVPYSRIRMNRLPVPSSLIEFLRKR
jgi:hypothetical protein